MRKTIITLLALGLVSVATPLAFADETKADCEPDQQWIGYKTSDSTRELITGFTGQTVTPCEGEQWDGQDNVQPAQNPGSGEGCTSPATSQSNNGVFVGSCMAPNPNDGGADPFAGNGQPVTFRVSLRSVGTTTEGYTAVDIALVGRAAVYTGTCQAGGAGIEGAASCAGNGQQRNAVYLRDNTPGNVLAQVVSAAGITKGHPSEADCDQSTYKTGANTDNRDLCGRDNTAITLDFLLP